MRDIIGQTVGRYRILDRLGLGGMASVYKAFDTKMARYVAVKIPREDLTRDPDFRKRFIREAQTLANFQHPHILPVFDFGEDGDRYYLVMRFVDGSTLRELIVKRQLTVEQSVRLVAEVAEALAYAHSHQSEIHPRGVVHRDVKPANVLVDKDGSALLTDFGIAKILEETLHLTGTNESLGTPFYMSPEQVRGRPVDGRTDIYSLGVVLYEVLTGRCPYVADTPLAVALMHISDPLPLPRLVKPDIPERLEEIVLQAMAKEPAYRFQTAAAFAAALRAAAIELARPAAAELTQAAPRATAPVNPNPVATPPTVEAPRPETPAEPPPQLIVPPLTSSAESDPVVEISLSPNPVPGVLAPPAQIAPSTVTDLPEIPTTSFPPDGPSPPMPAATTASNDLTSITPVSVVEAPETRALIEPSPCPVTSILPPPVAEAPATIVLPAQEPPSFPSTRPTQVASDRTSNGAAPDAAGSAAAPPVDETLAPAPPTSTSAAPPTVDAPATSSPSTQVLAATTSSELAPNGATLMVEAPTAPDPVETASTMQVPIPSTVLPGPTIQDRPKAPPYEPKSNPVRPRIVYLAVSVAAVVVAAVFLLTRPSPVVPAANGSPPATPSVVAAIESNVTVAALTPATMAPIGSAPSPTSAAHAPAVALTPTPVAAATTVPAASTPPPATVATYPTATAIATTAPSLPTTTLAPPSTTPAPSSPTASTQYVASASSPASLPPSPTSALPTPTESPPTATAVPPSPTPAPPTPVPSASAPALIGSSTVSGSIVLSWSYSGQLGPNQFFDVRVWKAGQPANGIANVTQTSYTVGGGYPAGTYSWTIAVISKQNGTVQTLSVASQTLQFTWTPSGGGGSSCSPRC